MVILVSSAATISMMSPIGIPLISYFICWRGGSLRIPGPVAVNKSALAKLWMWARSRTRMVIWVGSGELPGSSSPAPAVVVRAPVDGSHRGPESESGDGIDLEEVGTTVASVLVDEALDMEGADDPGTG